jgi:hypothetical protein
MLTVHPAGSAGEVRIDLPIPRRAKWTVRARVFRHGTAGKGTVRLERDGAPPVALGTWDDKPNGPLESCSELTGADVELSERATVVIRAEGDEVSLDKITLVPAR